MSEKKLSPAKFGILGIQHVFAMFGATVLVPMLTGLPVSATLLFAGLGTLLFHLITGRKVPAFLGSSFAFLGGYAAVKTAVEGFNADAGASLNWIPYAGVGVICARPGVRDCQHAVPGPLVPRRSCGTSRPSSPAPSSSASA